MKEIMNLKLRAELEEQLAGFLAFHGFSPTCVNLTDNMEVCSDCVYDDQAEEAGKWLREVGILEVAQISPTSVHGFSSVVFQLCPDPERVLKVLRDYRTSVIDPFCTARSLTDEVFGIGFYATSLRDSFADATRERIMEEGSERNLRDVAERTLHSLVSEEAFAVKLREVAFNKEIVPSGGWGKTGPVRRQGLLFVEYDRNPGANFFHDSEIYDRLTGIFGARNVHWVVERKDSIGRQFIRKGPRRITMDLQNFITATVDARHNGELSAP